MDNNMDKYIGKLLDGRYEIIEKIGVGGMAVVYKALCHRLNRYVAVKILKDELAIDEDFRHRFHTESQAVAMLSHSNIVTVYDVSRSSELEYIVMELIEGITLKQYMQRRGILTWKEALHFATQITKALSHAHSRGIIHRDIKPHNIMILLDSSVKVADFGIARLQSTQNTLTQETLGSVHYISPEQAKGGHVDARTDIYSLGVVMYEMITGRLPFEGDSAVSVAIQHISSIPLMPREINPDIPAGLETITMKAMNPDLKQRYQSADELFEDLEEFRKNPDTEFEYNEFAFVVPGIDQEILNSEIHETEKHKSGRMRSNTIRNISDDLDFDSGDYADRRTPRRLSTISGIILIVLFFVGVSLFLWNYFIKDMFKKPETIEVPNLVGSLYEDIKQNPAYGDFNFHATYQVSDEYDYGFVIDQYPTDGRKVIKGSDKIDIELVVSYGNEKIEMPDVVNKEYRQAIIELQRLGLVVNEPYETVKSDNVTEGYIIETEPIAGDILKPGDTVFITVSGGPDIKTHPIPDLEGRTEDVARTILEGINMIPNPSYVEDSSPRGTVIYQSIAPDTVVPERTQINLSISTGPAETPTPTPTEPTIEPPPTDSGDIETTTGSTNDGDMEPPNIFE